MAVFIRRPSAPTSAELLDDVEAHFELTLPAEYRAFLLDTNGGLPVNDQFTFAGRSATKRAKLLGLYGVGRDGLVDASFNDLIGANLERPRGLPAGCLFVGEGETSMNYGKVVIACTGDDAGKVFYRPDTDDDKPTLYPVADSFGAFIDGLTHEGRKGPKPWQAAVHRNDLAALQEAMNTKPVRITDAIELAIDDGRWEILKFLAGVARKKDEITPEWLFGQALSQHRFGLVKHILTEMDVPRKALADCLAGTDPFLWLDLDLVRLLIDKGADVNPDPDAGDGPLHCAVTSTSLEAVQLLTAKGADPTATDGDGRTPLQLANRLEEPQLAQHLRDYEAEWAKRQPADAGPQVRPFDLCGVAFVRTGPPLTIEEILAFEKRKKLVFPPEYRWLLTQANGAILSASLIPASQSEGCGDEDDDYEDDDEDDEGDGDDEGDDGEQFLRVSLFPLREGDCPDEFPDDEDAPPSLHESAEEASGWYHDGSEIPKGMLPIGSLEGIGYDEVGYLLLGCNKQTMGQLWGFDHGKRALNLTLPELFALLAEVGRRPKPPVDRWADAIAARDLDGIRAALAEDRKMPWGTRDGRMPIRMMFEAKYDDAIRAYIESGNDLNPLLSDAINFDRTDVMKECLRRAKKIDRDHLDVLRHQPCVYRDPELRELLRERGVKFNKTSKFDRPLAHTAAAAGTLDALQFAIDQGADVTARDKQTGHTVLTAACDGEFGDPVEVVAKLLELGVKPNQWTSDGHTALHFAVSRGYVESAKRLIDAGESLSARHERYAEGMTIEQTRKIMGRGVREMEKMFADLEKEFGDDDDPPPAPDTSTPQGEKAAEIIDLMGKAQQNMQGMMGDLMAKARQQQDEGFVGEPANAQKRYHDPDAAARIIPVLEEYERSKRG